LEIAFLYFKYGTLTCDDTTVWVADASRIVRALVREGGANVDDDFTDYNLLDVPITCRKLAVVDRNHCGHRFCISMYTHRF